MTLSHSSVLTTSESQDSASSLVGLKRVSKNYIHPLRTSHSEANSTTSPPGVVSMLLIISGILLVCTKPDIWKSCFRNIQYILELKFLSSTVLHLRESWNLQSFCNLDYVNPNTSGLPLNCIKQHGSCLPPSADPEPPSERKTETLMSSVCHLACGNAPVVAGGGRTSASVEALTISHSLAGKLEHYLLPVTIFRSPIVFCKWFQITDILSLNGSFEELRWVLVTLPLIFLIDEQSPVWLGGDWTKRTVGGDTYMHTSSYVMTE